MNNILKQKGLTPVMTVLVISLVIGVLAAIAYFYKQSTTPQITQTTDSEEVVPVIPQIKNDKDLEAISLDLENTNLDQLDSQLDQLSID